ncbi:MAG: DUF1571 domain-containing protein [Pirellulales bacterium]|nr:DUF1571 domain-containing protein [Pirellulales bacterium]
MRCSWISRVFSLASLGGGCLAAALLFPAIVSGQTTPLPPTQQPVPAQPAANQAHPLDPCLEIAYKGMKHIKEDIKDYTCTLVKRERIDGKLLDAEYMYTKVRQEPFSVYMSFLKPDAVKGREVIYVHGANDGNLLAHEGKGLAARFGMVSLKPNSALAMKDNRYPITELGLYNLTRRLIEVAENDRQFGECEVNMSQAKINGRECTMMQVVHPVPRKNFLFHVARIYVDNELNVPIRYEAYDWPEKQGGQPVLMEEYTYLNLQLNTGLTDADFDSRNPQYNFK